MSDDDVITIGLKKKSYNQTKKWAKSEPSLQDKISENIDNIKKALKEYEPIPITDYKNIPTGTFIRYLHFDKKKNSPLIRLGGYMIKNCYPDYWVLKCGGAKGKKKVMTWSVPLQKTEKQSRANIYFKKKGTTREDRIKYGAEIYDSIQSGKYTLIETKKLEELLGHKIEKKTHTESNLPPPTRFKVNFQE